MAFMRINRWAISFVFLASAMPTSKLAAETASEAVTRPASAPRAASHHSAPVPTEEDDLTSNPTRPNWDTAASTTQCGVIEVDSGWVNQPMGSGVSQTMMQSSVRYGLTPKLDLRWGATNHMTQSGGGTMAIEGIGDQWLMARYRYLEEGPKLPALAFLYGYKVPTANPAKGFGSGYGDHQFVFIASRDFGKNHFDFNTVGTVVGGKSGHDGSAQFGLALMRAVTQKFAWMLESYGGPQPGTPDRFGAAFTGVSYTVKPTLVVDASYSRTYTAGSPREQFMFGFTYALRSGFSPISRGSLVARMLGR
jgi:hypothetical protein